MLVLIDLMGLTVNRPVEQAKSHLVAARVIQHRIVAGDDNPRRARIPLIRNKDAPGGPPALAVRDVHHHLGDRLVEHALVERQSQLTP